MTRTHKIRLHPTPAQEQYFLRAAGVARFAWNWGLTTYHHIKAKGKKVDRNRPKKDFRARSRVEFPFVKEVTKCAAEEALADLRRAVATYYQTKNTNAQSKFPGLRKRSQRIGGFGSANDKFALYGHTVRIPKLGRVNMAEALRFAGKVLTGRITERAGRWYLMVTVEVEPIAHEVPQGRVGIDFGRTAFATLSTGEVIETQGDFRQAERRLRGLHRGLARKRQGSHNRAKWKQKVACAYDRVRSRRRDFLQKFTPSVVMGFGIICIEDLPLKGQCRTHLAKSFHNAGIGETVRQLIYKVAWHGCTVQNVDRFDPSSKRCHQCGWKNETLALADRVWDCPACGAQHDRDVNAAINIALEGTRLLAGDGSLGVTPVEEKALTEGVTSTKPCSGEAGTFYVSLQER